MKRLLLPLLAAIALPTNQVLGSCQKSLESENYFNNEIIEKEYQIYYAINSDRDVSIQDFNRVGKKCEDLQLYRGGSPIDNPRTVLYGWYTIFCNGENLISGYLPLEYKRWQNFRVTDKNNQKWDTKEIKPTEGLQTECFFDSNNFLAPHVDALIYQSTSSLPGGYKYFHIWSLEIKRWQKGIQPSF